MENKYVKLLENGAYRIADTRVSLDSVIYAYKNGDLPETIQRRFASLSLAQIYGAIAFYLSNQHEIDEYLKQGEGEYEKQSVEQRNANPEFYAQIDKLRD